MDIQCPNPECRTINPANAKFCRKCGTPLTHLTPTNRFKQIFHSTIAKIFATNHTVGASTFTLDTFSYITFQPVSVVKIRFVNRFVVFLCVLFVALWFATITGLTGNVLYEIDSWFYEDVFVYHQYIVELGCLAIAGLCALFILKWLIKKLRYKLNADYIEASFVNNEIVSIARKSRWVYLTKVKIKSFYLQFILILRSSTNSTY